MRVWVTRAQPGADATAARLRQMGVDPLTAPLTETRLLPPPMLDLAGVAALAFTSAAGVRAFAHLAGAPPLPVYAVGLATATAAREAGFTEVAHADGDGWALARLIVATPPKGALLVPGAAELAFDLPGALAGAGVEARILPLYATAAIDPPPAAALSALASGALEALLLHAPSAARALEAAAPANPDVAVLALSPACAPRGAGWRVVVAAAPRERDLLALLPTLDTTPAAR